MILAVDTSIGSTAAVVAPDGVVLGHAESASPRGHAEVIGDLLVAALEDAGVVAAEITHVATGMGPGPFTGLRIGIAAGRAFAVGRGIDVVPVASHDAAALAHIERTGDGGAFAIVTDARRRENAVSVYRGIDEHGLPVRISGPELHPQAADLAAILPSATVIVPTGTAADDANPADAPTSIIRAADLGRVAARVLAAGVAPGADEPLYLRSPDVTVGHVRKRVST
ncbi:MULTISPECIES: tRNA (adenosine(37)-N6)-threonylcarbamoyltransferase complex dimerization subunit type 1 TsaB [unclassified Microbacterium]|uniref:tRNA (adenosine(37)-N6)-threonylcarbamoyltransferase complex dimerization subunit type 1 TsaB n=1 Tax=unclassified Microbacterium TaxID=2609290 RepID=UPI00097F26E3|nr:tRNA (adenosine(37)-N6)-threonylcarbamoyltransferase complex dimerization subunit type 1 TsaB [Microbacterium sp. JB110]RCS57931.1 tRNA (adenosine(37)-N6)-threonylcarbamoyltransferase complex dimerization subunit type 1 TsaB [Microbacterium sp. JB110]SJM56117.1 TsaB protein, required for threonylcarbamoyladenosine (t(6)A) formation in tRNA [Frigoribacterium sp. JB110]